MYVQAGNIDWVTNPPLYVQTGNIDWVTGEKLEDPNEGILDGVENSEGEKIDWRTGEAKKLSKKEREEEKR